MKILIISVILQGCFFLARSQNELPNAQNIIADVTDLATFSVKSATSIFIQNNLRGGQFSLYNGPDSVDNGMIFKDGLNRKWIRKADNNVVNVQWYGIRPYVVGLSKQVNDSYTKFMAAVKYVYAHKQFNTVYIPYVNSDYKQYYFLSTITLDKDIKIVGDGTANNPKTVLLFPPNTKGFSLQSSVATHISLENLFIQQETIQGEIDSTAHAIETGVFTYLHNIYAYNIAGDGVHIAACATPGSRIEGNADQSILEGVQTYNCMNGLSIEGCDANVIDINNCSFVNNKRWGVYDNGLLGNLYRNCHFSNNGKQGGVVVTYNNNYYAPVDKLNNTGKRPDQNPAYWYKIAPVGGAVSWEPSKKYWSGGVAIIANPNAYSRFDHCYTESFQPPVILNNRSSYEGGDIGSEVMGGILVRVLNGTYIIYGSDKAGTQVDKLGVGESPSTFSISATGTNHQLMRLTSPSIFTELRMANTNSNYGGVTYYDSLMLMISNGNYTTAASGKSFYPYRGDNMMDLGKTTQRWANIYGNNLLSNRVGIGTTNPASALQVNGSFATAYIAVTANYSIGENDYTIDCTQNSFSVILPSAEGIIGRMYVIVNSGLGKITIISSNRQTIGNSVNDQAQQTLSAGSSVTIQSTGKKWRIL
ncbi:hypothetical protein [Ferruginibacter sp.]